MKRKNSNKLSKRFPDFYPQSNFIYKGKSKIRPYDFAIDDGWFDLIWDLSEEIEQNIEDDEWPDFYVTQIKEKFGGLRFYISGVNKNSVIYDMISAAERDSYKTCETCGSRGEVRKDIGWWKTKCWIHYYKDRLMIKVFGKYYDHRFRSFYNRCLKRLKVWE